MPPSPLKIPPLSSHPRQREITHSPRQQISKLCFPQQQKGVEETIIRKIKSKNKKMEHYVIYILYDL